METEKSILAIGYYHQGVTIILTGEKMEVSEAQIKKGNLEREIALLILKFEKETSTKVSNIKFHSYELQTTDGGKVYGDFDITVEVKI